MATNTIHTHAAGATSQIPCVLTRTLHNLDGYLAATRHGAEHPWRLEIAGALGAAAAPTIEALSGLVVRLPFSEAHITEADLFEHAAMRSRQLRGLLFSMQTEEGADEMLALAYELAVDVAEDILANDFSPARPSQLARLLLMIQGPDGPDDMLWLCQQFADEIVEVVAALAASKREEVAA